MRLPQGWWKFVAVFFIALTVLHFSHFTDLKIVNESGYQLRTTDYTESIYHLGIINAVAYEIPRLFLMRADTNFQSTTSTCTYSLSSSVNISVSILLS